MEHLINNGNVLLGSLTVLWRHTILFCIPACEGTDWLSLSEILSFTILPAAGWIPSSTGTTCCLCFVRLGKCRAKSFETLSLTSPSSSALGGDVGILGLFPILFRLDMIVIIYYGWLKSYTILQNRAIATRENKSTEVYIHLDDTHRMTKKLDACWKSRKAYDQTRTNTKILKRLRSEVKRCSWRNGFDWLSFYRKIVHIELRSWHWMRSGRLIWEAQVMVVLPW